MDKIKWCFEQSRGIEIIAPNSGLSEAYLNKAEKSLKSLREETDQDWKITKSYYTMYFSLYAVLMKIGIKSEIHSCTIEFMQRYLSEYFNDSDFQLFESAFKSRVDMQYYTDRVVDKKTLDALTRNVHFFMSKCKELAHKLKEDKIKEIREKLKKFV